MLLLLVLLVVEERSEDRPSGTRSDGTVRLHKQNRPPHPPPTTHPPPLAPPHTLRALGVSSPGRALSCAAVNCMGACSEMYGSASRSSLASPSFPPMWCA